MIKAHGCYGDDDATVTSWIGRHGDASSVVIGLRHGKLRPPSDEQSPFVLVMPMSTVRWMFIARQKMHRRIYERSPTDVLQTLIPVRRNCDDHTRSPTM